MKPEAQRIAIAEACGWKHIKTWIDGDPSGWPPEPEAQQESISSGCDPCIPDYLTDLNAMHEAEKVLTPDQRESFALKLNDLLSVELISEGSYGLYDRDTQWDEVFNLIHATAAQRAEAFLRTLNLWKP